MKTPIALLTSIVLILAATSFAADLTQPIADASLVFEDRDGLVAIEGEHFYRQTDTDKRAWHITSSTSAPEVSPDGDPAHVAGASGGAYIEVLSDTRRTHGDKLVHGENFTNQGGEMAVLSYKVRISSPGRYYVWVRAYSTTTEDNGLHFGLDGQWPESAARWQTVQKNGWHWDCKQRTDKVHTGVPMQLWLDIEKPGDHELLMAMREDGIEVDRLVLAKDREWKPVGLGPAVNLAAGKLPEPFPALVTPRQSDGSGQRGATQRLRVRREPQPAALRND